MHCWFSVLEQLLIAFLYFFYLISYVYMYFSYRLVGVCLVQVQPIQQDRPLVEDFLVV